MVYSVLNLLLLVLSKIDIFKLNYKVMNRLLIFFVFVFMFFNISSSGQDLYDINNIRTINMNFYDENWDYILDTMILNHNEDRILADLIIDGITYDSVGVRYKGNSSYHPDRVKNPFNIKVDYIKNQDVYGVKKLKLSNMFKDPSCLREVLSYEILRNYIPASKANFIFLYINGNIHGLYTSVESIDKDFVKKHFGSDENSFFKCDPITITGTPEPPPPGCLPVVGIASPLIYMGDDTVCYQQSYEIKSDFGWTKLMDLILELNENPVNVHQMLNIDRALWMLVFNNIFVNLDSYTGSGHNYYVYENEFNRFNTIGWDLNENFGVFKNGGQGPPLNLEQMIYLSTKWNYLNPDRPLINKLLDIPEYWNKYYAHYRTMYKDFLLNDAMKNRAIELQQLIDTCVYNDPNLLYTYQDFLIALDQNIGFGNGMIPGINVLMDGRTFHLSNHPELTKQGPEITDVMCFPEFPNSEDTVWITAVITNSYACFLHYKTQRFAPFINISMFDDGNHHDGAANDDVFGAMILPVTQATTVYYYIYAENNDAAMFSPKKAEFDSYSYLVQGDEIMPGDIVINEFLADNDSVIPDQNDEYDDWFELFNNTDQDICLEGIFVSDDFNEPGKWIFPDTTIGANDFIIVWADDDEGQEGLHANFKLSKSGEEIILSNSDLTVLDSIQFGEQFTDTTFGRFPNGTGDFQFMPPTFGAVNQSFAQQITLSSGYSFVSSRIIPENPDMEVVVQEILSDDLQYIRNSDGAMLRKIGPNWVNGIGDWIGIEGYLIKTNAAGQFTIEGTLIPQYTPIELLAGFQFVSYLPVNEIDALDAFSSIIGDDLLYVRNSEGNMLRKIGYNWINGIGNCIPTEGYLIKMAADAILIYPGGEKAESITKIIFEHFFFNGGNAAEQVYTIYVKGLDIGDEVAAFNEDIKVGAMKINSQNTFENELPVFSTVNSGNGNGYRAGKPIILKVWNISSKSLIPFEYTMIDPYNEAYMKQFYPSEDGLYSIINITKGVHYKENYEMFSVFPNPSDGVFTIVIKERSGDVQIKVLDLQGKQCYYFEINGTNSTQFDLSGLSAGIYFIKFTDKNVYQIKKIVIK